MKLLDDSQKQNLKILRDFLAENKDLINFDMSLYCALYDLSDDEMEEISPEEFFNDHYVQSQTCETSMCMIGWAGTVFKEQIETDEDGHIVDDWDDIGIKLFGVNDKMEIGKYLFSSDWHNVNNTVEGAIDRIDQVLVAETQQDYEDLMEDYHNMKDNRYYV